MMTDEYTFGPTQKVDHILISKEQREVWEYFRPASEAMGIFIQRGWDLLILEELEQFWHESSMPVLMKLPIEGTVRSELERIIRFSEHRIKQAMSDYENQSKTFTERKYLMEQRIPIAEQFLKKYQTWRNKTPSIKWEPMDVVDIKRRGIKAFVRSNLERFYN